ncbi:hypothetical protein F4818DRAFT_452592 [Hypoxylon cercidicola]|nr:hypothetical protein F4818DRAFT_452592 [Hypoxylon cercidicola]
MTQLSWPGDRMPMYPSHNPSQRALSYTTPTPNRTSNGNGRNPAMTPMQTSTSSVYPSPGLSTNPSQEGWARDNMGWGTYGTPVQMPGLGEIQMSNQFLPGAVPNQWMPGHMNDPNPSLSTINRAPALSNHMSTAQNGPSFSNQLASPTAPSSDSYNDDDMEDDSVSSPQGGYRESRANSRIQKRVGPKGRPRVGARNDRRSTGMGNDRPQPIRWYKGIKQQPIPEDATEEEKERLKRINFEVGQAKKEHTREQNRVSAQKSRQRKQTNLENALQRVEELEEQMADLQGRYTNLREAYQRVHGRIGWLENERANLSIRLRQYEARQPNFNPFTPLQGLGAQGQTQVPAGNPVQYQTPISVQASSPAVASSQASNAVPFGYMQQAQASQPTPNSNQYHGQMQPAPGTAQGQSGTAPMGFGYGFNSNNGASQSPALDQQGTTPANVSGNMAGSFQRGLQGTGPENVQGDLQNDGSEEPSENTPTGFFGDAPAQDQQEGQQQQPGGAIFGNEQDDPMLSYEGNTPPDPESASAEDQPNPA